VVLSHWPGYGSGCRRWHWHRAISLRLRLSHGQWQLASGTASSGQAESGRWLLDLAAPTPPSDKKIWGRLFDLGLNLSQFFDLPVNLIRFFLKSINPEPQDFNLKGVFKN
jgi:hypothetical protein